MQRWASLDELGPAPDAMGAESCDPLPDVIRATERAGVANLVLDEARVGSYPQGDSRRGGGNLLKPVRPLSIMELKFKCEG